ncbi:uncharacterized protein LOC130733957 [Lotus japonicus]|uniref:uncharacterized protein LOC130733957 n=1 Tax=Lotus japonicus TaxID=34305 RepID=UPI0025903639|nr:uncharacterized protein LOC130733957 [Lotus japonicus]
MTRWLIQILSWLMQPNVWRFVSFASAVVGLLCNALSSSFNHLFGDWTFFKISLYSVFSVIMSLMMLFAKKWRHSRSLQFKAHLAFLVLTITSLYSFISDKVMNGKPDVYSLISCAAFAIMSLSISRQIQCGFEVDLLYFFLGCLMVQLMKTKLVLVIVGAGFSYSLIVLRSSFSSIDGLPKIDHIPAPQEEPSIDILVDSQHLARTDIASVTQQLSTHLKDLQQHDSNLRKLLLERVKEYLEHNSELVATDHNFIIDALPSETLNKFHKTAKLMVEAGFEKVFFAVYSSWREEWLKNLLGDTHKMAWQDLKDETGFGRWVKASNVALKILFPNERQLCDRILLGFSSAADFSFTEVCRGSVIQLLNFADVVAIGKRSLQRLSRILEVFETLTELIPEYESLFCDQYSLSLRNKAITIWKRLGEAIRGILNVLESLVWRDPAKEAAPGGAVHPFTRYVMYYLQETCRSWQTLEKVFENYSLSAQMHWIIELLESNLEAKSTFYKDPAVGFVFLMNNGDYIVQKAKDSELGTLLGDDWIQKHTTKVRQYLLQFRRTMTKQSAATSVQDLPGRTKNAPERTVRFPAPQVGDLGMPPEDGFTWRKYGQKVIHASKYPRNYYRCTRQKCLAKKRVQRLDDTPEIYEVTYRNEHTCYMSLAEPSLLLPSQQVDISKYMTQPTMSLQFSPSSSSVSGQSFKNLVQQLSGSGSTGGGVGPSTSEYSTDYPIADMVDAMFTSSCSNVSSVASFVPFAEDKWEPDGAPENEHSEVIEVDSPQLVSTDIAGMMQQLSNCMKGLQQHDCKLTNILLMPKEHVDDKSMLLRTDINFVIDALPSERINSLHKTVKLMVASGFEEECSKVYSSWRRRWLEECLINKLLELQENEIENEHEKKTCLDKRVERWIEASQVALLILFREWRLCNRIFSGFSSAADSCFTQVCQGPMIQMLNFAAAVADGSPSAYRLFKILDMFMTLNALIPEFQSLLFPNPLVNEAIAVQNRLGEASRDLFMEFEILVFDIPEVKLLAPPNGGHHPMMNNIVAYLNSAYRSQQILEQILQQYPKVATGAETSSFMTQMKRTLKLLEKTLVEKSENYKDPALPYFFMMNNWRLIEVALGTMYGHDLFQNNRAKVQKNLEQYRGSSWNKMLDILKVESNESEAPNVAADLMKDKLNLFNMHFEEICRVQSTWSVIDEQLREEIRISVNDILLPAYGNFIGRFQDVLGKHAYEYIEYGLFDIEDSLNYLFVGAKPMKSIAETEGKD